MQDIVDIPFYGKVRCGQVKKADVQSSRHVGHYIGIPFAQPPVDNLRFLPPKRALPWNGILHNKLQERIPVQIMDGFDEYFQFSPRKRDFYKKHCSEDCLYLNVFVPQVPFTKKLPVLVWFYGGSFQNGPRFYFDGTALAGMNDIIVVAPNYRINTFGFLSLGRNSPCKGNLGLLDQLEALKWVKECISVFGGDENNVTISGNSAGGISVHMHMLSPMSQGYFHKAISFSGTAAMERTILKDQSRATKKFLEILNVKETDPNLILNHLQAFSTEEIENANLQLIKAKYAWMPTLDGHLLTEPTVARICRGDFSRIPYMFGVNSSEGGWLMNSQIPSFLEGCTKEQFYLFSKSLLKWFDKTIDPEKALPLLLKTYNDKEPHEDAMYYTNAVAGILADSYFLSGVPKVARAHAGSGSLTYCYHYTHPPRYSHSDDFGPSAARKPHSVGADHADEVYFVWGAPFLSHSLNDGFRYSEDEKVLSKRFMTYISNFAKMGDPNHGAPVDHVWPRYTVNERQHLVLDVVVTKGSNLAAEACYLYYDVLPKL